MDGDIFTCKDRQVRDLVGWPQTHIISLLLPSVHLRVIILLTSAQFLLFIDIYVHNPVTIVAIEKENIGYPLTYFQS